MPTSRAHHRDPRLVGGFNRLRIANRPARLNDRRNTCRGRRFNGITEGEESIRRERRALGGLARFLLRNLGRTDTVHLPRADAQRRFGIADDNGV